MSIDAALRRLAAENDRLGREIGALEEALHDALQEVRRLEALAYRDSLTGLPNRRSLADSFRTLLSGCVLQEFAVLFVDLDDFKRVNESFGHQVGDALLREIATTLDGLARAIDALHPLIRAAATPRIGCVLSRLGGDEFAILVPGVKDRAAAGSVAGTILQRLDRPLQAGSHDIVVTASIGIALYPADGQTVDRLLSNADAAMYAAKRRGKACYEHYREASIKDEAGIGDTAVRSSRQTAGASLTSVASPFPASP